MTEELYKLKRCLYCNYALIGLLQAYFNNEATTSIWSTIHSPLDEQIKEFQAQGKPIPNTCEYLVVVDINSLKVGLQYFKKPTAKKPVETYPVKWCSSGTTQIKEFISYITKEYPPIPATIDSLFTTIPKEFVKTGEDAGRADYWELSRSRSKTPPKTDSTTPEQYIESFRNKLAQYRAFAKVYIELASKTASKEFSCNQLSFKIVTVNNVPSIKIGSDYDNTINTFYFSIKDFHPKIYKDKNLETDKKEIINLIPLFIA